MWNILFSQVIIEPVLNNQYLTKLQRMLPTIFSEFKRGEIQKTVENNPASRYTSRGKRVNPEEDIDQEGEGWAQPLNYSSNCIMFC